MRKNNNGFSGDNDVLLTEQQAADFVLVAPGTLRNDRVTGELGIPFVKLSPTKRGAVRYQKSALLEWIKARTYLNTRQASAAFNADGPPHTSPSLAALKQDTVRNAEVATIRHNKARQKGGA